MSKKKPTVEQLLDQLAEIARETAPEQATTPDEAYANILKHFGPQMRAKKETFVMLCLDGRRRICHTEVISVGTLTATLVHPREVFGPVLRAEGVSSIVVAHNHPSGDPSPSHEDRLLTERLSQAGRLLGVNLDDHLVIGKGCFVSMRRLGLMGSEV